MYAAYIVRRTQIYLGEEQDAMLDARARATGATKSALVRDAIDAFLSDDSASAASGVARMRAALAGAAGTATNLPSGADYVDGIRAIDGDRAARLDERRSM
ncbi:MAG: CopG family transcriptional regulator [Solirubrobacteraceae bacterium]|nr:CopG family transcriptional regulator [Solirubrobacteraceae bacterium]